MTEQTPVTPTPDTAPVTPADQLQLPEDLLAPGAVATEELVKEQRHPEPVDPSAIAACAFPGYIPLPSFVPFHNSRARVRLVMCGGYAGATTAGAAEMVREILKGPTVSAGVGRTFIVIGRDPHHVRVKMQKRLLQFLSQANFADTGADDGLVANVWTGDQVSPANRGRWSIETRWGDRIYGLWAEDLKSGRAAQYTNAAAVWCESEIGDFAKVEAAFPSARIWWTVTPFKAMQPATRESIKALASRSTASGGDVAIFRIPTSANPLNSPHVATLARQWDERDPERSSGLIDPGFHR